MRVIITGGTGLIGSALTETCALRGDEVVVLCRNPVSAAARQLVGLPRVRTLAWTASEQPEGWWSEVAQADVIFNLAGESIADGRWSEERKAALLDSRLRATRAVVRAVTAAAHKPSVVVSGSAVGYYGSCGDEELTESAPVGTDFLASVCARWEAEAAPLTGLGVRLVLARMGVVFAPSKSALQRMALPFRLFAGGPIGDGLQWLSWIHLEDAVGLLLKVAESAAFSGPVNFTAPEPVRSRELSGILSQVLHRPGFFPVPRMVLRVAVGEMADVLVTGQRVLPTTALHSGYVFRHSGCLEAVSSLLTRGTP